MVVLLGLLLALTTGFFQPAQAVGGNAAAAAHARLDSLSSPVDSEGFVSAARALGADSTTAARLAAIFEHEIHRRDSISLALRDSIGSLDSARALAADPIFGTLTSSEPAPPPEPAKIPGQITFIGILFILFLLPKMLQRFRIPGAITSLLLGVAATQLGLAPDDPTITLLSTLGIVALFLFAGLDIDGGETLSNGRPLILHGISWTLLALIVAVIAAVALGVEERVAALLSLAVVTPSTGFILSSLAQFGLNASERTSVRTYAVGSELIALAVLFIVLQATSIGHLALATAAMLGIVLIIPVAFRAFAAMVAPHAPKSEFAFLLMVAIVCAYATRLLGVYYLVGAFLVGVAAQRYRASHPAMTSEKMIDALESFGSVFIPFYFFHAGMGITTDHFTIASLFVGLGLVVVLVPLRIAVIALHRRIVLGEPLSLSVRPASAMIPTLVFTLVLLEILESRFSVPNAIAGGLILYTVVNTLMPGFVLRGEPADFEDVEALPVDQAISEG